MMNWKTAAVSFACLLGAAIGSYFLYLDLNSSLRIASGESIGKVEKRELVVRRKAVSSYVWSNLQANDELFKRDSIQTGAESGATLRMNDGSVLEIAENSLVILDETSTLPIQFLRGSVVVRRKDGDKRVSAGRDGKARVEELPIKLVKPDALSRSFVAENETKEILFSWNLRSQVKLESVVLQISTDKRFSSFSTTDISVSDPSSGQITKRLGAGTYFWRVNSKGMVSATRPFRILSIYPLQLTFPENAQVVAAQDQENSMQFRWLSSRTAREDQVDFSQGEHRIEIAKDPEFKIELRVEPINVGNGMVTLRHLSFGTNYWRVKSQYGDSVVFTESRAFEFKKGVPSNKVTPKAKPAISFPIQVKPEPGTAFNLLDSKIPIEASWSEVDEAEGYEIVVYLDSKVDHKKSLALRNQIKKTRISLKTLKPGDYIWTLRSIGKERNYSRAIPWRRFNISYGNLLSAPKITSPEVQ